MALSRTQLLTTLATTTVVRDPSPVNKAAPASPQWRRAAAARPLIRRLRRSFGYVLLGCGLVMIPWTLVLARTMPAPASVPHWAAAWVGLDALEALGFLTTGILAVANSDRVALPAAITATLLGVDAWFDTMTAAPGTERVVALTMALVAGLPLALLCAVIAWRTPLADGSSAGSGRARPCCCCPSTWRNAMTLSGVRGTGYITSGPTR